MTDTYILDNGIHLVMEYMPGYRSVSIGVWIRSGSAYETKENNGISHAIEHMLFKGTKRRDAAQMANEMTAIGGNMDAFTGKDCTCFYTKTLDIYASEAVDILGDMVCHSVFDEKELQKELGVICEEIEMYEDSPEDMVHEHLQKAVWQNHPLGFQISGDEEVVSSFTRDKILEFFHQFYVGENTVISVAGAFDKEQMIKLVETHFASMPKGERAVLPKKPVFYPARWEKKKDIEQDHLCLAFQCCSLLDEERYVLTVANSIIGGSANSRLFMRIRDELGLTYTTYSYGSAYEQTGLFQVYAAMQPENTALVEKEIFKIFDDVVNTGITEEELSICKRQIQAELILGSESTYNRMSSIGRSILLKGMVTPLEEDIQKICSITCEQVKNFCKKYLTRDSYGRSLVRGKSDIIEVR